MLIRGVGPGLAKFGVTGALPDPQLTLVGKEPGAAFACGGWDTGSDGGAFLRAEFAKVGAFALEAGSKDSVLFTPIPPGNYTVQLTSASEQVGTELIEIYEDDNYAARMLNLSTRAVSRPMRPSSAACRFRVRRPTACCCALRVRR